MDTVYDFIENNAQLQDTDDAFQLENNSMLKISLNGNVWTKKGSMVAYTGKMHFSREGLLRQGFRLFKKHISKEDVEFTKASGNGELFLADQGKMVSIFELQDDAIFIHKNNILAFEPSINWDIEMVKSITGAMVSGWFHVRLEGSGLVAIATRLKPLVLMVERGKPVYCDPNNTIAWSGNLHPEMKVDVSLGTLIGRASGDTVQMKFEGQGFVVVQPVEEIHMK